MQKTKNGSAAILDPSTLATATFITLNYCANGGLCDANGVLPPPQTFHRKSRPNKLGSQSTFVPAVRIASTIAGAGGDGLDFGDDMDLIFQTMQNHQ